MRIFVGFTLLVLLFSCQKNSETEDAINAIKIDFIVERFDKAFGDAKSDDLPRLKKAYPFMFPNNYEDEFWIQRMEDTLQQALIKESNNVFENFSKEADEIKQLFQH